MSIITERPSLTYIRQRVDDRLGGFVEHCLHGGYEAIVAIENEGVAVLLPQMLGESAKDYPRIIPDHLIGEAQSELQGRHVLVFDASAVSATKLSRISAEVAKIASKVTTAAFLLSDECPPERQPALWGLRLNSRAYSWAKERLVEKTLERPFPLDGDHLIFAYHYGRSSPNGGGHEHILRAAQQIGRSYFVSPSDSSIIRLTVDGIVANEVKCDPPDLWFEGVCKMRLFIDPVGQSVSFVPLVFPGVPADVRLDSGLCPYCSMAAELHVPTVEHESKLSSEHCFRRVVARLSTDLMAEFMEVFLAKLGGIAPYLELELAPVPDVLRGCWTLSFAEPRGIVDAAYERLLRVGSSYRPQLRLEVDRETNRFRFRPDSGLQTEVPSHIATNESGLEAWYDVLLQIGRWYRKEIRPLPDEVRDRAGLPFSEICQRLQGRLERFDVSRSLDVLLDEGMVRPRTVRWGRRFKDGQMRPYFVRAYTPGGEHIRKLLLALAATEDEDWDWLIESAKPVIRDAESEFPA